MLSGVALRSPKAGPVDMHDRLAVQNPQAQSLWWEAETRMISLFSSTTSALVAAAL
jgi:hypothetical protein